MKKKKLLAIVDDWERLERYEERLHVLFDFHSSPFGGHGIELAVIERPDVILLDLEFEDMNAEEALSLIRAQDSLRNIPVVVISGVEILGEEVCFLERPVSVEKLRQFLETLS
jgi:CheY-like chemotaxis protein